MRVLLAHSGYRVSGGEERHIELLVGELGRAGVEVEVFSPRLAKMPDLRGRIKLAAALTYSPTSARTLRRKIASWRPDIVHFHNLMPLLTASSPVAARSSGARVVLTAHNYRLFCPSGTLLRNEEPHEDCVEGSSLLCGFRGARDSRLEGIAYGFAIEVHRRLRLIRRSVDAYIAPSRYLAELLGRAGYPRDRIHVIPYGVPVIGRPKAGGKFALYAGRLSREKGLLTLLRAARAVSDVPIRIAGSGPLLEDVREARDSGVVEYSGLLEPSELDAVRNDAAFVVTPSEWSDILPLTALESLAAGVPVLTTSEGGLAEIAENGGCRVVPTRDAVALARGLGEIWAETANSSALSREALESARANYELASRTRDVIELYEGLLA